MTIDISEVRSWGDVTATRTLVDYLDPQGQRRYLPPWVLELIETRELHHNMDWQSPAAWVDGGMGGDLTTELWEAQLVSSQRRDGDDHALLIDIDHPVQVKGDVVTVALQWKDETFNLPPGTRTWIAPSTKVGHNHLYADVSMNWPALAAFLVRLERAGILEEGYVQASILRGKTSLRLPWVAKEPGQPSSGETVPSTEAPAPVAHEQTFESLRDLF